MLVRKDKTSGVRPCQTKSATFLRTSTTSTSNCHQKRTNCTNGSSGCQKSFDKNRFYQGSSAHDTWVSVLTSANMSPHRSWLANVKRLGSAPLLSTANNNVRYRLLKTLRTGQPTTIKRSESDHPDLLAGNTRTTKPLSPPSFATLIAYQLKPGL